MRPLTMLLFLTLACAFAAPAPQGSAQPAAHRATGERLTEWLVARGVSPEVTVVLISMLPVVELRGALPVGYNLLGLPLWKVLLLSVFGNMVPIFLIVFLLERVVALLSRVGLFRRFFDWLFRRTRSKAAGLQSDEFWGLAVFVGIPLPGTGAWTGALAAMLFGMPYWRSILSIFVGVVMAAAAVSIPCVVFRQNLTLGLALTGGALTVALVYLIVRAVRHSRARPG